jgi:hypothetical protein
MDRPTQEYCLVTSGNAGLADALQAIEELGLAPLYAPELAVARANAPSNTVLWGRSIFTPSIRATGTTAAGTKVVVYAHVPNYFSNPEHVRTAAVGGALRAGAETLPQTEFQRLVNLDEQTDGQGIRRVWVVDYETLRRSPDTVISYEQALRHPQTIPFLGSEQSARDYLRSFVRAHGRMTIGVWHADDFDARSARARLLLFGDDHISGLDGINTLGTYRGLFAATQKWDDER